MEYVKLSNILPLNGKDTWGRTRCILILAIPLTLQLVASHLRRTVIGIIVMVYYAVMYVIGYSTATSAR
jgi:predicted Abi (CAAX) family protease